MVSFYFDENFPGWMVKGLRQRGVDALTIVEDGREGGADPEVLERAVELGRVLVTRDEDFLPIERRFREGGRSHCGLVFYDSRIKRHSDAFAALQLVAEAYTEAELIDRIEYIPY